MAAEWWFYHLTQPPLAAALASLFEKCLEREWRVVVVSPDEKTLEQVNKDLWTYNNESFLPHGLAEEGEKAGLAARQPILLTNRLDNQNDARVLALLNGQDAPVEADFERVMVVFDDGDTAARGKARQQYAAARGAGQTVRYFQQTPSGGWSEKK